MTYKIDFTEYSKLQLEAWKGVLARIEKLEQEIAELKRNQKDCNSDGPAQKMGPL